MLKRFVSKLVMILFLINFSSCKKEQKVVKPITIEFKKEGELTLYKATSDTVITKFDIEIADNDYETQTGLMHRQTMQNDRAMLFVFSNNQQRSFYMKNTHIPLDIIYLDTNNLIVSFQKNTKPLDETPLPSGVPAQYVLEINAGLSKQLNLKVGDSMMFKKD